MSDTFDVELTALEGTTLTCLCVTGTAGDPDDLSPTRSFAILLLVEALYRQDRAAKHPLAKELRKLGEPWDEGFFRAHADRFVTQTRVPWRARLAEDPEGWAEARNARYDELMAVENPDFDALDRLLDEEFPRHQYELVIELTDAKYLEGFEVGMRFGTTAYDAWEEDPKSPARDAIPVRSTIAGKEKPAKKKAAKKGPAKKMPAKKK